MDEDFEEAREGGNIERKDNEEEALAVRRNVSIDWTMRETVRARLRTMVKRVLNKHGYPPDKRERAADTVIEQAEAVCAEWAPARPESHEREPAADQRTEAAL